MVRQWQELFYNKEYSQTSLDGSPDFLKLAEAYSIQGIELKAEKDLEKTVQYIVSSTSPLLVDVKISPQENVYPFVPPGKPITEILEEGFK